MTPLDVRQIVRGRPVEAVVRRWVRRRTTQTRPAADIDHANRILSRDEREIGQRRKVRQLLEPQTAVRETDGVEERGGEDPFVLGREELVLRHGIRCEIGEAGGDRLVGAIVGITGKDRILVAQRVVDPALVEVLARRLVELERVDPDAVAQIAAIGRWEQIQVRPRGRADGRKRPGSHGIARHGRGRRHAEVFLQPLDAAEEEQAVLLNRAAKAGAELVPAERRRLAPSIEEVARVHRAVAEEFESGSMDVVRAALGHEADDATHRPSVIGRIRIGDDTELLDRFDAQGRFGRRDGGRSGIAAHVGAVEQVAVRAEAHAVDVQLGAAVR